MTRLFELAKTQYSLLLKQLHAAGIDAVSEKNWSTLKSTAALIEQPSFAVLQVHQRIAKLKQQLPDKSAEFKAQPYRDIIHWARLIQPNHQKWQAQQMEYFSDALWWYSCSGQIKQLPLAQQEHANKVLQTLQKNWLGQSAYAHYSTLDVIRVYESIIPVFSEWLHYAKTELEQRGVALTPRLKTFYQNYLTWFEGALAEEKALLRSSLRERLAVGLKKGYGTWDNVIESLREELKAIGILPKEPKLEKALAYGYLTPEAFVTIRRIIEQEGSEAEKERLYALTGDYPEPFDKSAMFYQHYRIDDKGCRYFIPPARSDMIPPKPPLYLKLPRFLQQLFWGDVVMYTFFQQANCQFLLAQNKALLAAPIDSSTITLDWLIDHPAWKQSQLCLQLCRMEYERTHQWLNHILLFLFPSVKTLLQGYQADLKAHAEDWAMKQLVMLREKINAAQDQTFTSEQQNAINTAFLQLEQVHQQWGFSEAFSNQLTDTKQMYAAEPHEERGIPALIPALTISIPSLPPREAFPLALKQVIQLVAQTNNLPVDQLAVLEAQLQTDATYYDSVALRGWFVEYLANTPDLPRNLVAGLQAVLDDPKFSEVTLDRAENKALRELKKAVKDSVSSALQAIAKPVVTTTPLWDKDPWDDSEEEFQAHCHLLKQYASQQTQGLSVTENEKLCQYTLRCFKHIYELTDWDVLVLKRDRINSLLNTLIDVSGPTFALQQTLRSVVDMLSTVNAEHWTLSKDILLMMEIRTLENFIHRPVLHVLHHEAASYASQAELQFSRRQAPENAGTTHIANTETLQLR